MTEGEEFIADFLESENIKYDREVIIHKLKGDSKSHRKADFYLPKYKVYLEFFGQWNSANHKDRYKEKKVVYRNNSIPCIYIYPENLGIVEYLFHKRIIQVFKDQNLDKELLRYRLIELWKRRSDNLFYLLFGILLLYSYFPWNIEENKSSAIIGGAITGYQIFIITKSVFRIFTKGPINKRIYF